jgi:hypothetical protein
VKIVDELRDSCFDGQTTPLALEFGAWLHASRRFRTFAGEHRTKIRAKVRSVRDTAGMLDLRAELLAAMVLLREERFQVAYETYAAAKQRGPDFTVTFKTHTPFNVEVRRVRRSELPEDEARAAAAAARNGKLLAVLCDKVGQMPPSIVNLLWLAADGELGEQDVAAAAAGLRALAEAKDEPFFARHGATSATFLQQYRRLSGVVAWQHGGIGLWLNPLARHAVPGELANALRRLGQA